jgi:hypothetical protein
MMNLLIEGNVYIFLLLNKMENVAQLLKGFPR